MHRTLGGSQGHGLDSLLCHCVAGRPRACSPLSGLHACPHPKALQRTLPPQAPFMLPHWPHQVFILQEDVTHAVPTSPLPSKCPLSVTTLSTQQSCALRDAPAVLDWV